MSAGRELRHLFHEVKRAASASTNRLLMEEQRGLCVKGKPPPAGERNAEPGAGQAQGAGSCLKPATVQQVLSRSGSGRRCQ